MAAMVGMAMESQFVGGMGVKVDVRIYALIVHCGSNQV
jgi:hypothetical protein